MYVISSVIHHIFCATWPPPEVQGLHTTYPRVTPERQAEHIMMLSDLSSIKCAWYNFWLACARVFNTFFHIFFIFGQRILLILGYPCLLLNQKPFVWGHIMCSIVFLSKCFPKWVGSTFVNNNKQNTTTKTTQRRQWLLFSYFIYMPLGITNDT